MKLKLFFESFSTFLLLLLFLSQVYHHCAIGHRYDFLCPNYTLFDQTTFTCRFVNTVDCANSANHFNRNDELYVETTEISVKDEKKSDKKVEFEKKKEENIKKVDKRSIMRDKR